MNKRFEFLCWAFLVVMIIATLLSIGGAIFYGGHPKFAPIIYQNIYWFFIFFTGILLFLIIAILVIQLLIQITKFLHHAIKSAEADLDHLG